jgi:sulfofructose kinase
VGQNALDRVCRVDGPPAIGGKTVIREYAERPGGQVATAALAGARLGLRTAYAGTVGDDAAADRVLDPLRRAGIDVSGVKRVAGARTQLAIIWVDRGSGERSVLWYREPGLQLHPADLSRAAIESARALHLDAGDPEAAAWAAGVARAAGVAVFLDADTPDPEVLALLRQVDFPIVSREFAESWGGGRSLPATLAELADGLLVVTLGAHGAIAHSGDGVIESPGFRVEAVDTTGAGDAFHGAFVWAVLDGWGAEAALRAANAAAAMNCRAEGAQGGLPTRAELEAFLEENEPGPWREIEVAHGCGEGE